MNSFCYAAGLNMVKISSKQLIFGTESVTACEHLAAHDPRKQVLLMYGNFLGLWADLTEKQIPLNQWYYAALDQ